MAGNTFLLDPQTTAEELGIKTNTLAKWRVAGGGPPFVKIGSRIRYSRADLDQWIDARRRRSTSDAARAAETRSSR